MRHTTQVCAVVVCFFAVAFGTSSQERRTTPALELLNSAKLADARTSEQGFEIHAVIKLEQEKAAEAEGTYLLVWASPTRWREEFSVSDFHQVRVSGPGGVWEKREPYFLSLPMWQLMQALNFYGRLELPREESAGKIKKRKSKGSELRCVEISRDSFPLNELCFHKDSAQLLSEHYLPSDRRYEFADFRSIRTKFFPGHITVYEGKTLVAAFSVSRVEETDNIPVTIFEQPAQSEWRPWCASPESGGDPLTPIYSRLVEHKTISTLYGAIGTDGRWYRVHVLESGGPSHDAKVLEALKKERWKPSSCNGVPIMVETVFRR
jgi:hypothetical protein